jgi:putative spermidine/putrescine transport system ATP-binding protein
MSSVALERLRKRYRDVDVVRDVDLDIGQGELVVLLGPSGCGKTTTLRMIAGLVQPTSGHVRIGGETVDHLPPRSRNIGMVFQDYALFPNMPVRENIAFGLQERGTARERVDARVAEMLALIRMQPFAERFPAELSGGQQQRVALARALAYQPRVLLMDEPLGALDQRLREDMQRELARIQRSLGITTVFVTHDQQEAMVLADRIVVMNAGRIEQVGTPEQLYANPHSLFIADFVGRTNRLPGEARECAEGIVRVALRNGRTIAARPAGCVRAGDPVVCTIRPESLRIAASHADERDNLMPATMRRRSFLGSTVDLAVEDGGGAEMLVKLPASGVAVPSPGDAVLLAFRSDDCLCFPAPVA